MPKSKFRYVSKDEAFDAICFLQTFEPQNESEANDIEVAVIALQKIIQKRDSYDARKDQINARARERLRSDPEYRERIQRNRRNYEINNRETIRAKNRKYYAENYKKDAGVSEIVL